MHSSSSYFKPAVAQVLDTVAQLGGALEFILRGGGTHLVLEACQRRFDLLRCVIFNLVQVGRHFEVVGFDD